MNDNEAYTFQMGERKTAEAEKNVIIQNNQMPVTRKSPFLSLSKKKRKLRFRISLRQIIIPFLCLIIAYWMLVSYVEKKMQPILTDLAEQYAKKHLLEVVNREVGAMAREGLLDYSDMVHTVRDATGEVIYLEVDTAMLAGAKSTLVDRILTAMEESDRITVKVPLGRFMGMDVFSGVGLPVRIRLFPLEMAEGEISTALEDCGINQTRHMIQVTVRAKLFVALPGENKEVSTEAVIPLGERVLVGDVPEIYLDTLGVH